MDNKKLKKVLDDILKPLGFKKKGSNWYLETNELIKVINLQKSNFGNYYYINYGFIIKKLNLQGLYMHIQNRLGSEIQEENDRISTVLDLENRLDDDLRILDLETFIKDKLLDKIKVINSEEDILKELKERSHLNAIPLIVKKYFNLI